MVDTVVSWAIVDYDHGLLLHAVSPATHRSPAVGNSAFTGERAVVRLCDYASSVC